MSHLNRVKVVLTLIALIGVLGPGQSIHAAQETTLTLAAFSVAREAYSEIIPQFQADWLKKAGQTVKFQESYQGSGAQSRAVVGGFEADVVALSLEADVTRIVNAKLITHDWKQNTYKGMASTSVAVLAVRPDNPKQVKDWADLAQPGLEIVTPDPASSGGAQWNLLAAYGAAKRGHVAGHETGDESALQFLGAVLKNVVVLDKDARTSILNFQNGVGDVAITYESETFAGRAAGGQFDVVYPVSTILIENPVALVDVYVDKHGTRAAAEALIDYLWTPQAQQIFAKYGYRPVDPAVAKLDENVKRFPAVNDLFTIDEFGGWSKVGTDLFGDSGTITKLMASAKGQ